MPPQSDPNAAPAPAVDLTVKPLDEYARDRLKDLIGKEASRGGRGSQQRP